MTLDREGLRRLAADELGLPTAPFWFAGSVEELTAVAEHAGFPLVVKPVAGVAGRGPVGAAARRRRRAGLAACGGRGRVPHNRVMAETVVEIDYEVTLLTVRTTGPTGPRCTSASRSGTAQRRRAVLESWQPQQMSDAALDAAKSIAARIVNALGGRGVFGVELLVRGDEVYFADVRTRPHDSGLVTLRSQRLSEFELHARAILGPAGGHDHDLARCGRSRLRGRRDGDRLRSRPQNVNAVLADALAGRRERRAAVPPARRDRCRGAGSGWRWPPRRT